MFSRAQRLTNKKIFERLFRQGKWIKGRYFSLRFIPAQKGEGQIAFVVSTKITKLASERNRIKRRLRASFAQTLRSEKYQSLLSRYVILVVVHRRLDELSPTDLELDVAHLVNQL